MKKTMKVNFVVDRILWKQFQGLCARKDLNASQGLRALVRQMIANPRNWPKSL